MRHSGKGNLCLLMAALIWGGALVAQKAGMEYLGPFGFTAIRSIMGGVLLLPLVRILEGKKTEEQKAEAADSRKTLKGAILCGIALAALILFQQFGLPYTTVGKAGFITALYILLTPVIGIALGKKTSRNLWIGVVVGLAGMYMLCLFEGLSGLTFGDGMMLGAALICAIHVHLIDHFVEDVDPVKLSCYQFIVAGLVCVIPAMVWEAVTWEAVRACAIPLLYAGVCSCAGGYTLQVVGQKYTDPNLASLILSLETVFSLFAGWVFFREVLTIHEYIGCGLMFAAIVVSQIPQPMEKDSLEKESIDTKGEKR